MKKILATTLIFLFLFTSSVKAADIQTYNLTIGVNPDGSLIEKPVTGYKHDDVIIETDIQGNPVEITDENGVKHSRGYILKGVVGQIKTEEPVWIDKGYDFDKVHEIKRLKVDFWLPNVITGEEYYRERAAGSAIDRISSHNYYFNAGGQITFVPEEDDDTYTLIGIVSNSNDYPVKGTVTANIATKNSLSNGLVYGVPFTKTCLFPPGISMVNMGSIKDMFTPEGIFYCDGFTWDGPTYYPPTARYSSETVIEDILHPKYPSGFKQSGNIGGFIPLGDCHGVTAGGTPIAVFTENGGMRFMYNFIINCIGAKTGDTWNNVLQGRVYGSAVYNNENNKWEVNTDNETATPYMNLLFDSWGLDIPIVVTGLYGDKNIVAKSKDGNMYATFDRLWPKPVGVMALPPGQALSPNFGGWHKTFQNPTERKGNMFDEWIHLGAIINPKILNQRNKDVNKKMVNNQEVSVGTYRTVGKLGIGYYYYPNDVEHLVPVIMTYPCFVAKNEIVPLSNSDIVGINKISELGWVVKKSHINKPRLIIQTKIKNVEVTETQRQTSMYETEPKEYKFEGTPTTGWQCVSTQGQQIDPQYVYNMSVKITYETKLKSENGEGFKLKSNSGNIELALPHLTNQSITLDRNYLSIAEKFEKYFTKGNSSFQSMRIADMNIDPVWNLNTNMLGLSNGNIVFNDEKTITFNIGAKGYCPYDTKDRLLETCKELDSYEYEAAFVNGYVELPPNDISQFNNIYSINKETVFSSRDDSCIEIGSNYAPPIYGTSYLSQPLLIKDMTSLQLDTIASYRIIPGNLYRTYDKATGTVSPKDYFRINS